MNKNLRLKMQKGDLISVIAVCVLIVLSFAVFMPKEEKDAQTVQIFQNGNLIKEVPLNKDAGFVIEGDYANIVTIENGAVSITKSTCPGADCVHTGSIKTMGKSIVCLPNRVEIRLVGAPTDIDFTVR